MKLLTAATITDEQIRKLQDVCLIMGEYQQAYWCSDALGLDRRHRAPLTPRDIKRARARCAEILNARAKESR